MAEGNNQGDGGGAGGRLSSQAVRQVADAVARALVNGRSVEAIVSDLTGQGWKPADARSFVETIDLARRDATRAASEKLAIRRGLLMHFVLGILWIVAGVTLMLTAKPERDLSSLGVAVIAFGVIEGVWALRNWRRGG